MPWSPAGCGTDPVVVAGVGVDIVDVERFERLLEQGDGRFLARWFRPAEVESLLARREPARHTAAQFAAKEAVLKALRVPDDGPVRWREIEIVRHHRGLWEVRLHGSIRELARSAGVGGFRVAVALTGRLGTATALAVSEPDQSETP